jgi:predicted nucleic acid-binding Zn ribbon protein
MFCLKCGKEIPDHSTYCAHCGNKANDEQAQSPRKQRSGNLLPWILVALLAVAVGVLWYTSGGRVGSGGEKSDALPASKAREPVHMSEDVVSGTVSVPVGRIHEIRILVMEKMQNVRVVGHFSASGGPGNDVQVVLAD